MSCKSNWKIDLSGLKPQETIKTKEVLNRKILIKLIIQ